MGSHTGPFIHRREGRGVGGKKPCPASHRELPDLQQQKRISQVWTHKRSTGGDPPFFPQLLFSFSLLPAAPHMLQAVSANSPEDILFTTCSRKAEEQKSSCQAWHCKEVPWGLLAYSIYLASRHFSPKYTAPGRAGGRSLLKQPGMEKAQVLRENWMTKRCSIQGSALRKANHQRLAILCCGSLRKHRSSASSAALPGNKTQKGPFLTTTSKCLSSFHHVWFGFEYSNIQAMNSWFFFFFQSTAPII